MVTGELPHRDGEEAQWSDRRIIGYLFCEGEEDGPEFGQEGPQGGRSVVPSQNVHEVSPICC